MKPGCWAYEPHGGPTTGPPDQLGTVAPPGVAHRQHVVTLVVGFTVLALVVELAEEVERDDGVDVDDDARQHHGHQQLEVKVKVRHSQRDSSWRSRSMSGTYNASDSSWKLRSYTHNAPDSS